jgi:hypothetical protein
VRRASGPVRQLECDLNALSRRSSSDLISLSSFLRSSSAVRLTGSRTGSQLLLRSRSPFANEGSLLLISTQCCLLISRAFFHECSHAQQTLSIAESVSLVIHPPEDTAPGDRFPNERLRSLYSSGKTLRFRHRSKKTFGAGFRRSEGVLFLNRQSGSKARDASAE